MRIVYRDHTNSYNNYKLIDSLQSPNSPHAGFLIVGMSLIKDG